MKSVPFRGECFSDLLDTGLMATFSVGVLAGFEVVFEALSVAFVVTFEQDDDAGRSEGRTKS